MKTTNIIEIYEEILKSSQSNATKLHLTLTNGTWRNGIVISINDSYFTFLDKVNGKEDIFFVQIKKIMPFKKEVEK